MLLGVKIIYRKELGYSWTLHNAPLLSTVAGLWLLLGDGLTQPGFCGASVKDLVIVALCWDMPRLSYMLGLPMMLWES